MFMHIVLAVQSILSLHGVGSVCSGALDHAH